jgi:hypothetical protein
MAEEYPLVAPGKLRVFKLKGRIQPEDEEGQIQPYPGANTNSG